MDLTVDNKIIAKVDIRPIQLTRLLGAFELVVPFSGTVYPVSDRICRSLAIVGARVALRGKDGRTIQIGRAVPDNGVIVRQYENATNADFIFKLPLQPHQLEAVESERNGSDLHLTFSLQARASSSDRDDDCREQFLDEKSHVTPRSHWVEQLNQSEASRILLLEVHFPDGDVQHAGERHLRRAMEMFVAGEWRGCVFECRQLAESIGGGRLAAAIEMLTTGRRAMTKQDREDVFIAALQHYCHLAAHPESQGGEMDYSRADAKLALSFAASLAEHRRGRL